jgi:4-hydroxybutyryl-CoA dehydratase/vinylacetyl-CoA-Delta-isomerase
MLMSAAEYRESLRRYRPHVFVDGRAVESVADEPAFAPGVAAIGLTYDYALRESTSALMRAAPATGDGPVNRMLALPRSSVDLVNKLEAVRLVCQETGCAQRYLGGDALAALWDATARVDEDGDTDYHERLAAYVARVQGDDLTLGIAMTDAKGDRSLRPGSQPNRDTYVHVVERRGDGVVISGTKAIVTSAPYVHELLVLPSRRLHDDEADFAVCCAVPVDAPGLTIVARPAGRAKRPRSSAPSPASPPPCACSIACSCRGHGCSPPARPAPPPTCSRATPHITGTPASPRAPGSATC